MDITVRVRKRGAITLPAELREKYSIRPGDTFRLVDRDGIFVLTPMVSEPARKRNECKEERR